MRQAVCNGTVSVRLSVCPVYRPRQQCASGLLLCAPLPGDIDRLLQQAMAQQHGSQQQMRAVSRCSWRMKLNRLVKANDLLARVPSRLTKDHRPTDLRPDRHHQLSRCWRCHYMPLRSIYSSMDYDTIFAEANAARRPSYDRTAKARLNTRHNNLFSVHFVSRWHGETSTFRCPIDGRVHCFSGLSLLTVIYI